MSKRQIHLTVPDTYQVPTILQVSEPHIVAQALDLGAHAIEHIKNQTTEISNKEIYADLKRQATKQYEKKEQEFAARIDNLQIQNTELSKTVDSIGERIRQEERQNRQELLEEKDKVIISLKEELKSLRMTLANLTMGFQDFRSDLQKAQTAQATAQANTQANSSIKGRKGEVDLINMITNAYGNGPIGENFTCQGTSKDAYSADIRMEWRGGCVLWESKNYKDTVNSKEVQKFRRDMEMNKEYAVGVMVSLYSGIAGYTKYGNCEIEALSDGRQIIYLSNLLALDSPEPGYILGSIRPFLEVFVHIWRQELKEQQRQQEQTQNETERPETIELIELKAKKDTWELRQKQLNLMLGKHLKNLVEGRNQFHVWTKKTSEMMLHVTTMMREYENYTKQMLDILFNKEIEQNLSEDNSKNSHQKKDNTTILDTTVFKSRNIEEFDAKEQKFIKNILEVCEVVEDEEILGKDLKEELKKKGWTEDGIKQMKAKVFQPDVWEIKSKNVKHLKFRNAVVNATSEH